MPGKTPRGRITFGTSDPQSNIDAAKARALRALDEKDPKLTTLERAFYERFKELQVTAITKVGPGRYVVQSRRSKTPKRAGGSNAHGAAA